MKKNTILLFSILISLSCFAQNDITNTIGTNGSFIIKDGTTAFFSLSQSDGGITLPETTSPSLGVINKGSYRFIHDFKPAGAIGGNTFMGMNSGNFTMTALTNNESSFNTGIGASSLYALTTGSYNTALGFSSLFSNSSGSNNTAVGFGTLSLNTIGQENTAMGANSLQYNSSGYYNTAIGYNSLLSNTAGFHNTAVGHHSLLNNDGNYNTALGYNAGSTITTGSNLTLLGIDANPTSGTATNQITLGNGFVSSLRCNVQSISSLSDARDKKNIKDLNLGIDFLMKIKPRLFYWDKREWYSNNKSDGSKMKEEPTAGFIAQELDEVQISENAEWLNLVLKDNPEKLEATSGNLLPIIVKAIQDLKKENDELKARLIKFEQVQNTLTTEIQKLETNNNEATKVSLGDQ